MMLSKRPLSVFGLSATLALVFACSSPEAGTTSTSGKPAGSGAAASGSATTPGKPDAIPTDLTIGPNGKVVKALTGPKKQVTAKLTPDEGAAVDVALDVPEPFHAGSPDEGTRWLMSGADDAHGAQVEIWLVDKDDYDAELDRTKKAERTTILENQHDDKGWLVLSESQVVVSAIARKKIRDGLYLHCQVYFFHDQAPKLSSWASAWAKSTCLSAQAKPAG